MQMYIIFMNMQYLIIKSPAGSHQRSIWSSILFHTVAKEILVTPKFRAILYDSLMSNACLELNAYGLNFPEEKGFSHP